MRRRLRWTRALLTLHQLSAVLLAGALLLYTLTGAAIVFGTTRWEAEQGRRPLLDAETGEEAARLVGVGLDPRARLDRVRSDEGGVQVVLRRPGRHTTVTVAPGADHARVQVRVPSLATRMAELHGQRRYRGGAVFVLWAALADASAVALVAFSASGLVLAVRRAPRLTAAVFGAAGLFTLTAIVQLWLAP